MTTGKTLLGLLIVAGGLVFYLMNQAPKDSGHDFLIAALSNNETGIKSLDRVLVTQGEQQFDMRESDSGWHLNGGFYVRVDSLFNWVQALKNARLIERKTANPAHFTALSLTEEDLRVRLYRGEQLLADVILGQTGSTPGARFVRYAEDTQSWLASGLNDLNSSKELWTLTMLFDVPDNQVQVIEWTAEDIVRLVKDAETGQWQSADPATDGFPPDQQAVGSLASALSGFRIQQALEAEQDLGQPQQVFVFGLTEGRSVTLALFGDKDSAILKVTDSDQPERYLNWQFTVPDYKLDTLMMSQSEALKKPSEDTEKGPNQLLSSDQTDTEG